MNVKKLDYKKEYKDLYLPKASPSLVEVPAIPFIMVEGAGDPNLAQGQYQQAIEILYALSYTIKMSKMSQPPQGYFEYVMPPLEGLWWLADATGIDFAHKDKYCWISMIRQPDFVTQELFDWALTQAKAKKPHLQVERAVFRIWQEGLCAQLLHTGPYEQEPASLAVLEEYIQQQGYQNDIGSFDQAGEPRRHHEIYLGDPRRIAPEKRKTILRVPVRRHA